MSTHRYIDRICLTVVAITLIITMLFMNAEGLGIQAAASTMGYESRLFDDTRVHTVNIVMDDWEDFISTCENEEYSQCAVIIDNESYKNVGIRAKGNTSLSNVSSLDSERYSFKIEFDHYDSSNSYYGLDKLCLNNIIQDNTYMKDYLCYKMMGDLGVASPLCSFVYITVNGEDWGLYLAVEGVEESFLTRNYGSNYGELYKPDSMSMGGGKGGAPEPKGGMENMAFDNENTGLKDKINKAVDIDESITDNERSKEGFTPGVGEGTRDRMMMGSSDTLLVYTDDEYDSYSGIFDSAKTEISDSDKDRLIASIKALNEGDIESSVDIDSVIRYFAVHNFVCNFDSYTGSMIHNYYLYEEDGLLSMLPWDYNLAFGGFKSDTDAKSLVIPLTLPYREET